MLYMCICRYVDISILFSKVPYFLENKLWLIIFFSKISHAIFKSVYF